MGTSRFLRNLEGKKLIGGVCTPYYSTHNEWREYYKWRAILDIRPRDCCRTVIYQITCRAVCGGNDSLTGVFVATFLRVTNDVQKWVLRQRIVRYYFYAINLTPPVSYIRCSTIIQCTLFAVNRKTLMVFALLSSASGTNRSNRTANMYKETPSGCVECVYQIIIAGRIDPAAECQQWLTLNINFYSYKKIHLFFPTISILDVPTINIGKRYYFIHAISVTHIKYNHNMIMY